MGFPIKLHTIKLGWSIVYIEGSKVVFVSLKIYFVLANSADPDEMPHYAVFHLGLHCLPKYPFRVHKGLMLKYHTMAFICPEVIIQLLTFC